MHFNYAQFLLNQSLFSNNDRMKKDYSFAKAQIYSIRLLLFSGCIVAFQ